MTFGLTGPAMPARTRVAQRLQKDPRNRKTVMVMNNYTHDTVPTQYVENEGIRYAYRRFGKPGSVPLLFLEYFNSNMDGWDPSGNK